MKKINGLFLGEVLNKTQMKKIIGGYAICLLEPCNYLGGDGNCGDWWGVGYCYCNSDPIPTGGSRLSCPQHEG